MEKEKASKAYRVLSLSFVVYTLVYGVVAIALFWACYFSGKETGKPYSDGRAAQFLMAPLLPMLVVWVALIVALFVFYRLAKQKEAIVPSKDLVEKYRMFRPNAVHLLGEAKENYETAKRRLVIAALVCGLFATICLAMAILFFCLFKFDQTLDATEQTINVLSHVLPWVLGIFLALAAFAFAARHDFSSMIKALSSSPKGEKEKAKKHTAVLWTIRGIVLVAAIVLIVIGANHDGAAAVLRKATAICMECLGIG